MKQLTWKLVIPLTILSFPTFTLDWTIESSDGFNYVLTGFPFPYYRNCLHTSLCQHVYILPLLANFLSLLLFWFLLIFGISKLINLKVPNLLTGFLITISGLFVASVIFWVCINSDNIYTLTRPFDINIIDISLRVF